MTVHLRDDIAALWAGQDPFAAAEQLQGEIFRAVKNRRTLRFEAAGHQYFIKIHHGVGWPEIIKNLISGRLPIISARQEWRAIRRLTELDVPTMTIAGFGERGWNPARRDSFLITDELANTVSLETLCADWPRQRPRFAFKHRLLEEVARISRRLHENGVCHRDFYLCHFLLHCPPGVQADAESDSQKNPRLSVIDLHRAMIRDRLSRRWIEKDIAGLYFSSLQIGLTHTDLLRFVKLYTGQPLREALITHAGFLRRIQARADRTWQRDQRKARQHKLIAPQVDDEGR
ncbi:MAG: lipopolysaccharide core heptose(I) kinase RfaP [Gammaproteobacteria bacterium]|nr:lipopolysaccharide core heptose(I) kinase RfaP [Gammaproteobacteria bacterium]